MPFVIHRHRIALTAALVLSVAPAACHRGPKAVTAGASSAARMSSRPNTGLEVIGWMRRAHPSRALRGLTFSVITTEYRGERELERHARAYALLPGRLRVDVMPSSARASVVRNRQRMSVFNRGRRVSTTNRVDLVQLLAYDVFAQSIDTTIMWLDSANVRFALLRRDFLEGREVWVVGAARGDETSPQFWVDAERWHVVRVIQRDARQRVADVRFSEFVELLEVPVPKRIVVYVDGELAQEQRISNLAANPRLPARAFDLSRWRSVRTGD